MPTQPPWPSATRRNAWSWQQVTFPDLTWDHFHWEHRRRTGSTDNPEAADRYRETRAAFESKHGEIVSEYWSIVEPSAVALTFKKAPLLLSPFINDRREFHRSTDWVTRHNPPLADVLFDCENLSIRISEVLRYTSESVGLKRLMAVASHVLGVIDRAEGKVDDAQADEIAAKENHELREIRDYYRRAGVRIGLTVYTQGMIIGLLLMALLVGLVLAPLVLWGSVNWDRHVQEIVLSAAAGAIGAFVSVLQRMASDKSFPVHYDLGKRVLYMLGSYRPVLGAVFGVFTYFVLASGILGTSQPADTTPCTTTAHSPSSPASASASRGCWPRASRAWCPLRERRTSRTAARGQTSRKREVPGRQRLAERLTSSGTPPARVW